MSKNENEEVEAEMEVEVKQKGKGKAKGRTRGKAQEGQGMGPPKKSGLSPGVIVLRNIPHGFYEEQMLKYFTQFGKVLRLRLSRSRKTGKSRGYAYIEFEVDEVAKIVAQTMDSYLMFEHLLRCQYIPPEKVHPKTFYKWNLKQINTVIRHKALSNGIQSHENERKVTKKRLQGIRRTEQKLADLGIDFECVLVNDPRQNQSKIDMVIDSSDDEIKFKTPPNVKKIMKKAKTLDVISIKPKARKTTPRLGLKKQKSALFLPKFSLLRAATKRSSM